MTPLSIIQDILDKNEDASLRGILYVRPQPKPASEKTDPWTVKEAGVGYVSDVKYDHVFDVKYISGEKNLEYQYQTSLLECFSNAFLSSDEYARAEYGVFADLGSCVVPCVDLARDITLAQASYAAVQLKRLFRRIMGFDTQAHIFQTGNSYHIYLESALENKDVMVDSIFDWYHGLNSQVSHVDHGWTQMLVNTKGKSGILRTSAGQNNRKVPVYVPT